MENIDSTFDGESHGNNEESSSMKISNCSREQLLEMLALLEAEVQARDVTIATLQNEKLRHMLYEAKLGRGVLDDPYLALERDGAVLGEDLEEDMLMRAAHETKLLHLDNLLLAQHHLVEKLRSQLHLYETRYSLVCKELEEEQKKSPKMMPSVSEKKTDQLQDELVFERSCSKALQEDMALMISAIEKMRLDLVKHKKVALTLIKERKLLAECLLKDRQRLKELEDAALSDDKSFIEEKIVRLTQEKSLLEDQLKQEETRHRAARVECDRLRQQLEYLQSQLQMQSNINKHSSPTNLPLSSPTTQRIAPSTSPANVSSFTVTSRVPLDNSVAITQRALAPTALSAATNSPVGALSYSYRSASPSVVTSTVTSSVIGSSIVQPFQNQINLQSVKSSVSSTNSISPVTPTIATVNTPRLNYLPPGQAAVLTTSSGQRISLHVSPSRSANSSSSSTNSGSVNSLNSISSGSTHSPMIVQSTSSGQIPLNQHSMPSSGRPVSGLTPSINSNGGTSAPTGSQRPVPPVPLSPANNNSIAVSSSFNITIRPDGKGGSTFIPSSTPPEPPARVGVAFKQTANSNPVINSPSNSSSYQVESPTEANRYLTIKKMGVATSNSHNN